MGKPAKFHINSHGVGSECEATVRNCPLGFTEEQHYATKEEATAAGGAKMAEEHGLLASKSRKAAAPAEEMIAGVGHEFPRNGIAHAIEYLPEGNQITFDGYDTVYTVVVNDKGDTVLLDDDGNQDRLGYLRGKFNLVGDLVGDEKGHFSLAAKTGTAASRASDELRDVVNPIREKASVGHNYPTFHIRSHGLREGIEPHIMINGNNLDGSRSFVLNVYDNGDGSVRVKQSGDTGSRLAQKSIRAALDIDNIQEIFAKNFEKDKRAREHYKVKSNINWDRKSEYQQEAGWSGVYGKIKIPNGARVLVDGKEYEAEGGAAVSLTDRDGKSAKNIIPGVTEVTVISGHRNYKDFQEEAQLRLDQSPRGSSS